MIQAVHGLQCWEGASVLMRHNLPQTQSTPGTAERNAPVCGRPGEKDVWLVQDVLPLL